MRQCPATATPPVGGKEKVYSSPRVIGNGYDGHGREVLTYIRGDFVHPHATRTPGATQGYDKPAVYCTISMTPLPTSSPIPRGLAPLALPQRRTRRIIRHRDAGPWNIVPSWLRPG